LDAHARSRVRLTTQPPGDGSAAGLAVLVLGGAVVAGPLGSVDSVSADDADSLGVAAPLDSVGVVGEETGSLALEAGAPVVSGPVVLAGIRVSVGGGT